MFHYAKNYPSQCDIELLEEASNFTYKKLAQVERVKSVIELSSPIMPNALLCSRFVSVEADTISLTQATKELTDCLQLFNKKGYQVLAARGPLGQGSIHFSGSPLVEKTRLGYAVMVPKSDACEAPIVIAFRGTKGLQDMPANANLAITGTVGKALRDEAYQLYMTVRSLFAQHKLVFTGHSQGGNLAHYVSTKAMSERQDYKLECRTFNSANIDTVYGAVLLENPYLVSQFGNFRTSNDLVSQFRDRYGSSHALLSSKGTLASHKMHSIKEATPAWMKLIRVGHLDSDYAIEKLLLLKHELDPQVLVLFDDIISAIEDALKELRFAQQHPVDIIETLQTQWQKIYGTHPSQVNKFDSEKESALPQVLSDPLRLISYRLEKLNIDQELTALGSLASH